MSEQPDVPPPPPGAAGEQGGRNWKRIGLWAVGALIVLIVVAAVFGEEEADDSADAPATSTELVEEAPSSTPAQPEPAPEPEQEEPEQEPEPEPVDTGRMSEGEFERMVDALADMEREIGDYRAAVSQRCVRIYQALQVAEGIECVDDAYSGVEDSVAFAQFVLDDLKGDTGGRCLRVLGVVEETVNRSYFRALRSSKAALDVFRPDELQAAIDNLNRQEQRYSTYSVRLIAQCAPS